MGLLNQYIAQKHAEKMQNAQIEAGAYGKVLDSYLNGEVDEPTGIYAFKKLANHLPKDAQESFQHFGTQVFPSLQPPPPPVPNQPNSLASQPVSLPPMPMDRSPVPAAPSMPPPPGQGPDQSANPISSTVAPAAAAPPPMAGPPSPAPTTGTPANFPHRMTPLESFQQRQLPLQRAIAAVGPEMAQAQVARYNAFAGDGAFQKLPPEQQADWIQGKELRFAPVHTAGEGQILYSADGRQIGVGPDKPVTTAPGAVTTVIPTTINGGVVSNPGAMPPPPGSATGGRVIASPPPLLDPSDRAAKQAWIAKQQQTNPGYQWTDADLPTARSAYNQATHIKTPEQENHDAIVRMVAEKAGVKLDDSKGSLMAQLPAGLQAKAVTAIKQAETSPSLEANRQMMIQLRGMQLNDLRNAHGDEMDSFYKSQVERGAMRLDQVPAKSGQQARVAKMFAESGQNPPVALSPSFQTALSTVDPVLEQIQRLKAELEPLKSNNTPGYFLADRAKYAIGMGSGTASEIADLSLASITGAARVLKGSSRAYQIFDKALDHTPNTWKDSPQLIYDKLSRIEQNLTEGKAALIQDGARSGVVSGAGASGPPSLKPPPGAAVPDNVSRALKDQSPGIHTLSDGSKWMKTADGTVSKR